jgi:ADP-ribose pyrophosphatase YjhB (NUDIX family)
VTRSKDASQTNGDSMSMLLTLGRRLLALSQTGLHFTRDEFDRERYEEVERIAAQLLALENPASPEQLLAAWQVEGGYATPKMDVRGGAFRDGKILLVRERSDGKWTMPGGWADVNDTPASAVTKEIEQESGFIARISKVVALQDRDKHNTPTMLYHCWKVLFLCEIVGGSARTSVETDGVDFFALDALPELSTGRSTAAQIELMFRHANDPSLATEFD